jgi:hypothetical protein
VRNFARRSEQERRDIFRETAQAMRVNEAIIEKDFWVCWVLDYLFHGSPWGAKMAFKGGTSLSKAYHAIERFSEDIDLILDWRMLGYSANEPSNNRSGNKQEAFNIEANLRCAEFLEKQFTPAICQDLKERAGVDIEVKAEGQNVDIQYPKAFSLTAITPHITLEVGPLAAWAPNEPKEIRPYAATRYPGLFSQPSTTVPTVVAERTFWEKATILHREAHRPPDSALPPHYSRHYYDLYRLSLLSIRNKALSRLDLLKDVVVFKDKFYHSAWSRYEEAKPGSLRLLPPEHHLQELKKDYHNMQPMLFGTIPIFEDIMAGLAALEKDINELRLDAP